MDFSVVAPDPRDPASRVEQRYAGKAKYTVTDGGVLVVHDEGTKRTYAPGAWSMVEEAVGSSSLGPVGVYGGPTLPEEF